ncbi:MAG: UDP-N-acetylmuramate dehydrogenase [Halieaceae bacterium]|jgi:UDP-N-acetylmuramate dehydrogenase|nr:UDP-N-acetylmuramate dehydrogenase [Halieaceae bacterium]
MIRPQQPLQALNTLHCPSVAAHYAELTQPENLSVLLAAARDADWPVTVLGEGSNVVLGDAIPGLVIAQRCRGIDVLEASDTWVRLRVAAGENWHALVRWCLEQGYHGLENLALIPGTVGAAPIQNIGAYGVEIDEFIEQVDAVSLPDGEALRLDRAACAFGYRDSVFKHALRDRAMVMSVTLCLPRKKAPVTHYPSLQQWLQEQGISTPAHRDVYEAVVAIRRARLPDPAAIPNVGSFFKNPVLPRQQADELLQHWPALPHYPEGEAIKLPAAWLIDQCGFRQRNGTVRVHAEHALVITNPEGRSAREVAALAAEIRSAVQDKFGILLEQEPRSYGLQQNAPSTA